MRLDNLAREDHDVCPAKYDLRHNQHWATRTKGSALSFGGATHLGLAEWYRSHDPGRALEAVRAGWTHVPPADDYRTLEKCLRVLAEYMREYPREAWEVVGTSGDNPMIEKVFTISTGLYLPCGLSWLNVEAEPCPFFDPPEAGVTECDNCGRALEPIEYGGIIDVVSSFSGSLYVVDHKTTSRLGPDYFKAFKPDNQMTGYIWAASQLTNTRVAGALINAIGVYKSQATRFERQLTTRGADDISQWLRDLHIKCIEIKMHERFGIWPQHSKSCTLYGLCEYYEVHSTSDRSTQLKILDQKFVKRQWDYEARDLDAGSTD